METVLKGKISSALRKNPYLNHTTVSYETKGRNVVLRGEVSSFFDKQMVQESLRSIEEIDEIFNELEVLGRSIRIDM